jgi:hypothetical protein
VKGKDEFSFTGAKLEKAPIKVKVSSAKGKLKTKA